jgi:hypothetical protein
MILALVIGLGLPLLVGLLMLAKPLASRSAQYPDPPYHMF